MFQIRTAKPDKRLEPFIDAYVQREYDVNGTELVEPVVARLGTMLEFQFAGPYDVPAYGVDEAKSLCTAHSRRILRMAEFAF